MALNIKQTYKALVLLSFISCTSHIGITDGRIEPNPFIGVVWSQSQYKYNRGRYYNVFEDSGDTLGCTMYISHEKNYYIFNIYSKIDTVMLRVHNSYIGTNVDSINIMLDMSFDTSDVVVYPNQSWAFHGKMLGGDKPISNLCQIQSTIPIHARVFMIVDVFKENYNPPYKTEFNYQQQRIKKGLDSIIESIPK